jgi:hypothetical protein
VTESPARKGRFARPLASLTFRDPVAATQQIAPAISVRKTPSIAWCVVFAVTLGLVGCGGTALTPSSKGEPNEAVQPSFADFSDMPIPASARMNIDRSLILGPKEAWLGRLVFRSSSSASEAFDFYANGMPQFSWQPVAVVRGATSSMTYTRGDRVASVQITGTTLGGSEIEITVAPSASASGGYGARSGSYSAPAPRTGGVQSAPLAR